MNATCAAKVSKITADELANLLLLNFARKGSSIDTVSPTVFLLDCRSSEGFSRLHIRDSHHVLLPAILYKRLLRGTLQPKHSLFADETKRRLFAQVYTEPLCRMILVADHSIECDDDDKKSQSIAALVYKKLKDDGCNVAMLEGGFELFSRKFPHLCQSCKVLTLPSPAPPSTDPFSSDRNKPPAVSGCKTEEKSLPGVTTASAKIIDKEMRDLRLSDDSLAATSSGYSSTCSSSTCTASVAACSSFSSCDSNQSIDGEKINLHRSSCEIFVVPSLTRAVVKNSSMPSSNDGKMSSHHSVDFLPPSLLSKNFIVASSPNFFATSSTDSNKGVENFAKNGTKSGLVSSVQVCTTPNNVFAPNLASIDRTCRVAVNTSCSASLMDTILAPPNNQCDNLEVMTSPPLSNQNISLKRCSGGGGQHQRHFALPSRPVEIVRGLFLGTAGNAADRLMLRKLNISHVLNVTPDLPNVFEADPLFHYLQLPIQDHWSQDLLQHFPRAIAFIDEARQSGCGVLVHCLAGISRSVTVTVAYLMSTLSLGLEDAYELVKRHKPNIAPNLNFMGQLLDFERRLYGENVPPPVSAFQTPALVDDDLFEEGAKPLLITPLSDPPMRRRRASKPFQECF